MLIGHANCESKGKRLEEAILSKFNNIIYSHLLELGGGLGSHAGPGALVVGLQKVDKEI